MSVGLSLSGSYPVSGFLSKGPSPTEWLTTLQEWLSQREGEELVSAQMVEGPDGEVLLAQLHPFADELQVSCPRLGEVLLTAATGSCGAGYHQHVVDLAHAIASERQVRWWICSAWPSVQCKSSSPAWLKSVGGSGFEEGVVPRPLSTKGLRLVRQITMRFVCVLSPAVAASANAPG